MQSSQPMQVSRILETCLYVDDLDRAEEFYGSALGLELESKVAGRHLFFRCGQAMLLLFNAAATRIPSGEIPTHGAEGPGHVAFAVTSDEIVGWQRQLTAQGVEVEAEVTWPGGGRSLYFRDPAGNSLELATPGIWGLA